VILSFDMVLLNNTDWFFFRCNDSQHSSALNMKHPHASLIVFVLHVLGMHYVCNLNALIHGHSDV